MSLHPDELSRFTVIGHSFNAFSGTPTGIDASTLQKTKSGGSYAHGSTRDAEKKRGGGGFTFIYTCSICSSYDRVLVQRVRPQLIQKYALLSMYVARGERPVKTRRQRGTIKLKSRSRMEQNVIHLWIGIQLPAGAFREFSTAGLTVTFGGRPPSPELQFTTE